MKKHLLYIGLCVLCACNDTFTPQINTYTLSLQLLLPDTTGSNIDVIRPFQVELYNRNKDYTITLKSDSNSYVYYDKLEAGIYTLSTAETYLGDIINTTLSGLTELVINDNYTDSLLLAITYKQVTGAGFVIREYYYSGSLTPAGKQYLDDQYIEIYNNGPDTLYADSIALVEVESSATTPDYWSYMHEDSFVVKMVWALPTITGKEFPIAPGDGFIMARDPMNHKSDANANPNSPVDLGKADFDFWSDKTPDADIDFPAPNLIPKLWVYKGTDVIFHSRGGSAIAIVKIKGDIQDYIDANLITKGEPTSSSKFFCKIANTDVLDAVESTWNDDRKTNKRIPVSLDAGYTFIEAGSKSGLCVRRKISKRINGRTIYEDTDNSTEDFEHDVTPKPGIYE